MSPSRPSFLFVHYFACSHYLPLSTTSFSFQYFHCSTFPHLTPARTCAEVWKEWKLVGVVRARASHCNEVCLHVVIRIAPLTQANADVSQRLFKSFGAEIASIVLQSFQQFG
jgi:hypothetical protein